MTASAGFLALAVVFVTGLVWFRRALAVQLPANRAGFVLAMAFAAALGVAALRSEPGWLGGTAAGIAVAGAGFFMLLVAISAQNGGTGRFQLGAPVPDLNAVDDAGEPFDISRLAGQPFLLKFFRGHW